MIVERDWERLQERHAGRVEALVAPHELRRSRGQSHPVEDFLFTYYVYRPNQLRRWHPGAGTALPADAPHRDWQHYVVRDGVVAADVAEVRERRGPLVEAVRRLMRGTLDRPARHGCFGMHEWAMVYRLEPDAVRHAAWPLRLPARDIAGTVEDVGLRCTHFDAYRFFTAPAVPRNATVLRREGQLADEQPGCLHAGMDLYKWAYKLTPLTSSSLVLDAFELARDIRYVDMQASPYDLGDLGIAPIPVERPEGRAQYVAAQRAFAERARPIRQRLLEVCENVTG
ncbi:3-methyladenine DNA glycosylase [Cumulibacter manganitolerans]|uniref:3-methyladenine DNA glycosylase n=1 Tax=Cumulibacter manganitolerans TaxID=1884992 RepID=UPI0012961685|nr:3-methyladenine DNA glycosylase [Cumulibacter manganitolerans]